VEETLRRRLKPRSRRAQTAPRDRLRSKNGFSVLQGKGGHVINPTPEQLDDWL
jgi:hypothetical protein